MKDYFNNEVKVGDWVEFIQPRSRGFDKGIVLTIRGDVCRIEWDDNGNKLQCSRSRVMLLTKALHPEYYL